MKLHEIEWSIYPLRVGVYLAEKGITDLERIPVPLPPSPGVRIGEGLSLAGTVPALDTGEGPMIASSIAIMEYLEDKFPTPNLIGETPYERARTREFLYVIDEAAVHMGMWVHFASPLFGDHPPEHLAVAQAGKEAYFAKLRLLDALAREAAGEFLLGDRVTMADCVTFATQTTSIEQFGVPFPEGTEYLQDWYDRFRDRPSGAIPNYPPFVLQMTKGTLLV